MSPGTASDGHASRAGSTPMDQGDMKRMPAALPGPARALQVLVVDDVAINRELLRLLLSHHGHAVHEAASGVQAVECVAAGGIDLVLMDVEIPGIDGLDATRRVRALPGNLGPTPVWIVSGHAFASDVEAALACGANGHLSKPVCFERLRDVLHEAQGLRAPRHTSGTTP